VVAGWAVGAACGFLVAWALRGRTLQLSPRRPTVEA
jgi:hypothetical protein